MEREQARRMLPSWREDLGLRSKLIIIFVAIKVVPLVLLASFAWFAASELGDTLAQRGTRMADNMQRAIRESGEKMTGDAIRALDERSREAIERLGTDTARAVAAFLYDRDKDILQAAQLTPDEAGYRAFLRHRTRDLHVPDSWRLNEARSGWEPVVAGGANHHPPVLPSKVLSDNARDFHARPPEYLGERESRPLFREMSFIGLDGVERLRVAGDPAQTAVPRDIKQRANTWARAEQYWPALQRLKAGEIYVSEVVGSYVGSRIVGVYTPAAAAKAGIAFEPEKSAYAGTENPLGRRFRGIVRWATPVERGGRIVGYVSLALDHDHVRQFTDRIVPTEQRYTPIIDAIAGNYAFMWDHRSRAIAHPRDYMIPGYDERTGEPVVPWLDTELYAEWKSSGLPWERFADGVAPFRDPSLRRRPAGEMIKAGTLGLDCRYLNFSPQCAGWDQLTEKGGSGSFVIFFSGLWKLTTAAAIPYYTGQYGQSPRGFGVVTIGANVADFHRAASESARSIATTLAIKDAEFKIEHAGMLEAIGEKLRHTTSTLVISTLLMSIAVIGVAIWMAQFMTGRIQALIAGIRRIESGDLLHRLEVKSQDEMGQLTASLNGMADSVEESFGRSEAARLRAEEASQQKSDFLAAVSHELRTPLNGILGFAELLELEATGEPQREYAGMIRQSGQRLLDQVNDLLDLAKIESGRLDLRPSPVLLPELLRDLIGLHSGLARSKGLDLQLELAADLPYLVLIDARRLRQVLNNLVHNALKFTDRGYVKFSAGMKDGRVFMVVADSGCGIAPELQALVFERFRQAQEGSARRYGGVGLGLSIARALASLMGGSISLRSIVGEGSVFTLDLPLTELANAEVA